MKKFHDKFPTKQKSFIGSKGWKIPCSGQLWSACLFSAALSWHTAEKPQGCSAQLFPTWKCAWVAGGSMAGSVIEKGGIRAGTARLLGPSPQEFCISNLWAEEHKQTADHPGSTIPAKCIVRHKVHQVSLHGIGVVVSGEHVLWCWALTDTRPLVLLCFVCKFSGLRGAGRKAWWLLRTARHLWDFIYQYKWYYYYY